jgi:hypothetical protein
MKVSKCIIKTPVRLDIFALVAGFQRDWSDMFDPYPNMSGFLKESAYA